MSSQCLLIRVLKFLIDDISENLTNKLHLTSVLLYPFPLRPVSVTTLMSTYRLRFCAKEKSYGVSWTLSWTRIFLGLPCPVPSFPSRGHYHFPFPLGHSTACERSGPLQGEKCVHKALSTKTPSPSSSPPLIKIPTISYALLFPHHYVCKSQVPGLVGVSPTYYDPHIMVTMGI